MTDDRARTALNELSDALGAAAAEYDRLRASSETADQNLQAFADAVSQAADSLRTLAPQHEQAEQEQAEGA
jgi:predicted  nucleic acid-binding Zn-ribbon protein